MPQRWKNVRVSVREKVETEDSAWGTVDVDYNHIRFQTLLSLVPLGGRRSSMFDERSDYFADWEALARPLPRIEDGTMLVAYDHNNNPSLWLLVKKRRELGGNRVRLMLEEIGAIQGEQHTGSVFTAAFSDAFA